MELPSIDEIIGRKNNRDELVKEYVYFINKERQNTKYKPITAKLVAIRLNSNPMTAGNKNLFRVEQLLEDCKKNRSFKNFFGSCPLPRWNKK